MSGPRFQVYEDASGQYRWRLKAANGRIIAESGEAYTRKRDSSRAVAGVVAAVIEARGAELRPKP